MSPLAGGEVVGGGPLHPQHLGQVNRRNLVLQFYAIRGAMKRLLTLFALVLALALGSAAAFAEDPIAKSLADPRRSDADRARDARSKPAEVLGFFGVKPGARVLDLFSGGGYYSEILARAVASFVEKKFAPGIRSS